MDKKYTFLCVSQKKKVSWGWVNDVKIVIFGWIIPLLTLFEHADTFSSLANWECKQWVLQMKFGKQIWIQSSVNKAWGKKRKGEKLRFQANFCLILSVFLPSSWLQFLSHPHTHYSKHTSRSIAGAICYDWQVGGGACSEWQVPWAGNNATQLGCLRVCEKRKKEWKTEKEEERFLFKGGWCSS